MSINSKKFSVKLLRYLESVFPEDMNTAKKHMNYFGEFNQKAIQTLVDNGLIEEVEYSAIINEKEEKVIIWKITSKGIEFLNGLRQKRTNMLLLVLTIFTLIIGVLQIILLIK